MTEKKEDKHAEIPAVRKGYTTGDAVLTVYDDLKSLAEKGKVAAVSAGGSVLLISKDAVEFIRNRLSEKMKNIPPENRQPPDPIVASEAVQGVNSRFGEENLREMFLNLLAAAMDKTQAGNILPAFTEILKNLSPDEARIVHYLSANRIGNFPIIDVFSVYPDKSALPYLMNFSLIAQKAGCDFPGRVHVYMENMRRLGLVTIDAQELHDKFEYPALENSPMLAKIKSRINKEGESVVHYVRKQGLLTRLGQEFCELCTGYVEK